MLVEKQGNVSIVVLPQRMTGRDVGQLLTDVRGEQNSGASHLAIDFRDTVFIDSSGIGSLVATAKEFKGKGIVLSLRNLNAEMKELFVDTGLDMIFNIETETGLNAATIDIFETSVDIKLEIEQEEAGDICVFHLGGVMNHPAGSRYFKQQFLLALAQFKKILIDFENLTFFDSLSVSVVLNMNKLLKETDGSLRLCGANYIVADLFATLNIGQIIPLFEDISSAKANWD